MKDVSITQKKLLTYQTRSEMNYFKVTSEKVVDKINLYHTIPTFNDLNREGF